MSDDTVPAVAATEAAPAAPPATVFEMIEAQVRNALEATRPLFQSVNLDASPLLAVIGQRAEASGEAFLSLKTAHDVWQADENDRIARLRQRGRHMAVSGARRSAMGGAFSLLEMYAEWKATYGTQPEATVPPDSVVPVLSCAMNVRAISAYWCAEPGTRHASRQAMLNQCIADGGPALDRLRLAGWDAEDMGQA